MSWYVFKPTDTLLFKDASSSNKGEDHTAGTLFPPADNTIIGALRTTMLREAGVRFQDYHDGKIDSALLNVVGHAGKPAPFELCGFLIRKGECVYVPTPYHWFTDKDKPQKVYKAEYVESPLITTEFPLLWARGMEYELENLGGRWIALEDFDKPRDEAIRPTTDFFDHEIRTGNALSAARNVLDGHLYSFTHIRLQEDVSLLFGVTQELLLKKQGILTLGGEQRWGAYEEIDRPALPEGNSGLFMALTPVEATEATSEKLIATGKLLYRGGWDLDKGFHKPMTAFYPAGSVFNAQITQNCIQL